MIHALNGAVAKGLKELYEVQAGATGGNEGALSGAVSILRYSKSSFEAS